jgi:hypothetical protein
MGICSQNGNLTGTITGNVSTETADNVLNVEVKLSGSTLLPINTNQSGMYTFPAMPVGSNYQVVPAKIDDIKNGVSTLDLVEIQKHLLGMSLLPTPYKMIAADANNNESISAVDLIEIRRLILGISQEFPNNSSWRFVDKTYVFPDPYNPWMQDWPEAHNLNPLATGIHHADFFGIKVGDVNNSVKANATSILPRSAGLMELVMDERKITAGEVIEVPVYTAEAITIEGMQMSLDLTSGLELTGVKAGLLDVTEENFGWIQQRILTSSWNKAGGVELKPNAPLFTLVLKATQSTTLSKSVSMVSAPTNPEAYTLESDIMDVNLQFRGVETEYTFELLQNEPNPFNGATQIGFVIPESGEAQLTLFDITGREIYNQVISANKGLNRVEVRKEQFSAQGIVYYQIQFQGYTATKKMLVL